MTTLAFGKDIGAEPWKAEVEKCIPPLERTPFGGPHSGVTSGAYLVKTIPKDLAVLGGLVG